MRQIFFAHRLLLIAVGALLLGACSTSPPINVRSAEAVIVQNEQTKKHIQTFTTANKKTQAQIKRVQEEAIEAANAQEMALKYLDELLGEE